MLRVLLTNSLGTTGCGQAASTGTPPCSLAAQTLAADGRLQGGTGGTPVNVA